MLEEALERRVEMYITKGYSFDKNNFPLLHHQEDNHIRRSPLSLSPAFAESLKSNAEVREASEKLTYRVDDVERYLKPKPLIKNPNPQPGFFVPRRLPQRPRKMLPLIVELIQKKKRKRFVVLTNLQNNPNIAPLFLDGNLEEVLGGREILTAEQKGKQRIKQIKAFIRLFGTKTHNLIDGKVSQIIEERPIPPLDWTPKGRHTRLRWVGATEKEIPGIGGRFILPSLDNTKPGVNTTYSTQGRARDEWDTMFKIPNNWEAGDDVEFSMNTKSKRFVGGNGGFDMPAAHL
nr:Protein OSR-1 [Haemonchus contortus]